MFKKAMSFLVVLLLLVPVFAKASVKDDYKTLNLKEVLEQEQIESKLGEYKESDDKATVYLFRGNGCGFCRGFLTFLNDNIDELGKYFNLVSFEVWGDKDNALLMEKVGDFTGVAARGVPYIIVGDKVFDGFTEEAYGEDFKSALKTYYEAKDRYDVFAEMEKAEKDAAKAEKAETNRIILWNGIFSLITIAAVGTMIYVNNQKMTNLIKSRAKVKVVEQKEELKSEVKQPVANKKNKKSKKK